MKSVIIVFTFLSIATQLVAQRNCGTAGYWQQQLSSDAALRERYISMNIQAGRISKKETGNNISDLPVITIPVVVHVLYNTDNQRISILQVQSQIDALNRDFRKQNTDTVNIPKAFSAYAADCSIMFELAKVDPDGYATTGIVYKKTNETSWQQDNKMKFSATGGNNAWDTRYYLNIWVCNLSKNLLGYSTFPGSNPDKDGVVIRTDVFGTIGNGSSAYSKGRTTIHEVGHWLNLKHLWGDMDCGDDGVDDTPQQKTYNSGCPSFPKITPGSCNMSVSGEMYMNYMDFSDDACILMFTHGQKQRMRSLFLEGGARADILHSYALGEPWQTKLPDENKISSPDNAGIFPNPVTNTIYLKNKEGNTIIPDEYRIYNAQGQLMLYGQRSSVIYTGKLSTGIYFMRIQYAGGQRVIKFVKE